MPTAPLAKSMAPAAYVGISTLSLIPAFGGEATMRSGQETRAEAATRRMGPRSATSAVK